MNKKEDESNISDALNVIKNAIEDNEINENIKDDVLLITKMIKKDGTILDLKKSKTDINNYKNEDINQIIDKKVEESMSRYFNKSLDDLHGVSHMGRSFRKNNKEFF